MSVEEKCGRKLERERDKNLTNACGHWTSPFSYENVSDNHDIANFENY